MIFQKKDVIVSFTEKKLKKAILNSRFYTLKASFHHLVRFIKKKAGILSFISVQHQFAQIQIYKHDVIQGFQLSDYISRI